MSLSLAPTTKTRQAISLGSLLTAPLKSLLPCRDPGQKLEMFCVYVMKLLRSCQPVMDGLRVRRMAAWRGCVFRLRVQVPDCHDKIWVADSRWGVKSDSLYGRGEQPVSGPSAAWGFYGALYHKYLRLLLLRVLPLDLLVLFRRRVHPHWTCIAS